MTLPTAKSNLITARNRLERADIDEPFIPSLARNEYIETWLELTFTELRTESEYEENK